MKCDWTHKSAVHFCTALRRSRTAERAASGAAIKFAHSFYVSGRVRKSGILSAACVTAKVNARRKVAVFVALDPAAKCSAARGCAEILVYMEQGCTYRMTVCFLSKLSTICFLSSRLLVSCFAESGSGVHAMLPSSLHILTITKLFTFTCQRPGYQAALCIVSVNITALRMLCAVFGSGYTLRSPAPK